MSSDGDAKVVVTADAGITAKKKRGRPPKNKVTDDGGDVGRGISDNNKKKARLHAGKSVDDPTTMGMEPSLAVAKTASSAPSDSPRDEKQLQTTQEIAASPYAPHMGIFLGHRVVKDFSGKGDRKPENYLGTVVAYCPPWTSAFGASDSDEADDTKESKSDGAYDEFAASSLRLWKGDDADLGGGDCQSESTGDNDKRKKGGGKKRRNGNKKKGKTTKNALESRSLQYCRRGRKLGEIPGLYRILFDDGDFEDEEPNDVYEGALKYHKMVREDYACIVKSVQRSPLYISLQLIYFCSPQFAFHYDPPVCSERRD